MTVLRWAGLGAGVVLLIGTVASIVGTLVVPRSLPSKLTAAVGRFVGGALRVVWRRLPSFEAKDRILALHGPLWLLGVLVVWMVSLWVAFALIVWPLAAGTIGGALREAGSSLLTLGFASTESPGATEVDFLAAATGLVVVALQIAYLPVLYGAFNRRETLVTMLESRAGLPPWGPEILWRHHRVGILDSLPAFYASWEKWCADVAETHATYPVLIHFRSPHPLRSWVTGLLAVLDSAAMYQALCPRAAPSEARLCLRMGFVSLRAIADALSLRYDADPSPDDEIALTYEEFAQGVAMLEESGFPLERSAAEAWPHFRGWRINYEQVAYRVADRVVAAPCLWSGSRSMLAGVAIPPQRPEDRQPGGAPSPFGPRTPPPDAR